MYLNDSLKAIFKMATIYQRINRDGSSTIRLLIRRKGIPLLCLSFSSYEEAEIWAKTHELEYIKNPKAYQSWIQKERLNLKRNREFKRKLS